MTDAVDMAAEIEREHVDHGVLRARAPLLSGVPGDCDECGHYMLRLVDGRCGFCRDGRLPPDNWVPPVRPSTFAERAPTMPAKSIQLPQSFVVAIKAVETLAANEEISQGHAAAQLIEAGVMAREAQTPVALAAIHVDALLDEVRRRFERAASAADLAALTQRAETAEKKLSAVLGVLQP